MADPVRVFVSHHHSPEEDTFTARLMADLKAAGADAWVDTAGITSDDFVKKISEGLAGRQWLMLVMTPDALRSPWVQREVNAALNEHTAGRMLGVLPFVMLPCFEQAIPVLWRTLHRYDATKSYEAARDGLLGAIGLTPALPSNALTDNALPSIDRPQPLIPPMCFVPAGDFLMGSKPKRDGAADPNEQPQHLVTLPAFEISRTAITVA
jgi:hypothetical protein